jgi:A/G-specific adenine glycosylase
VRQKKVQSPRSKVQSRRGARGAARPTHRGATVGRVAPRAPFPARNGISLASERLSLITPLLTWFTANARDLPWRRPLNPYAVWVSEIMLQQTQVKTVLPYFERWMRELPTIESLAGASSERIHKLWEGLGYYTRVRNMQKAAQVILEKHGGKFPREFDAVLALPGIGRYTAGAICSIAFNQPTPILDGNVIRVLTRVFGIRENVREKEVNARLWAQAELLVREAADFKSQISDFKLLADPCSALNQSLMELGALICTPRRPNCAACPVAQRCEARRACLVDELPNLGKRASATARRFTACVIERHGAVLVRQRPAGVVNGHLWEFPNVEVALKTSVAKARKHLETELGCALDSLTPLATVKHTITRYRITLDAFRGQLKSALPSAAVGIWITKSDLERLPFTSAHRRLLGLVKENASGTLGGTLNLSGCGRVSRK